jgi:hypothetical protein
MEQIVDPTNMERAWRKVKANRGAPGPDGITLDEFPEHFRPHLGIPNIQDRLIQQAILQVLTPIFDPGFSESSFGFRPKRSAHGAARQVQSHIRAGYRFEGYGGQIRVSSKNVTKFKQRVKEITRRKRGVSIETRLRELSYYLRGWVGYFGLVPLKSFFAELDKWIRRRLRSSYWKQWRKPRTRINKLLWLGLSLHEAIPFGSCSRGHWHMSQCRSVQQTLSNEYLASQGLVSLLNLWSQLAPKFRNA